MKTLILISLLSVFSLGCQRDKSDTKYPAPPPATPAQSAPAPKSQIEKTSPAPAPSINKDKNDSAVTDDSGQRRSDSSRYLRVGNNYESGGRDLTQIGNDDNYDIPAVPRSERPMDEALPLAPPPPAAVIDPLPSTTPARTTTRRPAPRAKRVLREKQTEQQRRGPVRRGRSENLETAIYLPSIVGTPAERFAHNNFDPLIQELKLSQPINDQPIYWDTESIQPPVLKAVFALGYMDEYDKTKAGLEYRDLDYGKDYSLDPMFASLILRTLTKPCAGNLQLCGFTVTDNQGISQTLMKTIFYPEFGPQKIEIKILHPAAYNAENWRNINPKDQSNLSKQTSDKLKEALQESDLVIYAGHSRFGYGPDFDPIKIKGDNWDREYYKKDGGLLIKTLRILKNPENQLKSLAVLSCSSSSHFGNRLRSIKDLDLELSKEDLVMEDQVVLGLRKMDYWLRTGSLKE